MDKELELLAREYVSMVDTVCRIMLDGLGLTCKEELCRHKIKAQQGRFEHHGDNSYFFHGLGCRFKNKDIEIDWDFGPGDLWCVIDPWKLFCYAKSKVETTFTKEQIEAEFENTVKSGIMQKHHNGYIFRGQ